MGKETLRKLEMYKKKHRYTDAAVLRKLKVPGNYYMRWRNSGRIIGAYQRIVEEFLEKEEKTHG